MRLPSLSHLLTRASFAKEATVECEEKRAIEAYESSDRQPFFAPGYTEYKERLILSVMRDQELRAAFRDGRELPADYGLRLDERVVEYPWVFSRLRTDGGLIVDAGSTFNKKRLLDSEFLRERTLLIYTLNTDWITLNNRVSYLFGDLRQTILKDGVASSIVCISTLEHVGFTYEYETYSQRNPWPAADRESYRTAVREFRRLLEPGGQLLLTVPYGRYEDHGWLQQFDAAHIAAVIDEFGGELKALTYYRYHPDGWRLASAEECAELEYFNIHERKFFDADWAAAARGVACLELIRA